MAEFHLTNKAIEDLDAIWAYTYETWSEKQADKYYFSLLDSCQELANLPGAGKKYDVVTKDLLGYKVNQHIIFYRVIGHLEIEIIRILHSKMDLKSKI